jgi:cyclic di-GMP phosphodiesterase
MEKITISTDHIRIGLYVSDLDRPWLETPFLFQGFKIDDDEEIAELRKHCKTVVVDVEQSDITPEELRKLIELSKDSKPDPVEKPKPVAKKVISDVPEPDFRKTGQYYVNTEELGRELARAKEIEKQASVAINSVIDGVRNGQALDVPQLEQVVDPLVDSVLRNSDAMAWLMRIRETDEYVYQHSIGSSVWAVVFGRHLGFDKETLNAVGLGGMLLDIGKTRIPVELLRKAGPLNEDEMLMMYKHVDFGLEILRESGNTDARIEIMLATHHERFDGTGYPNGLKDTQIPVLGRVAGIVDCYDAMVSKRPYAETQSTFNAMRQLQSMAKGKFQKEMVDQFVQAVGMFPTGSLVELNTGEVAVVTAQNNYQRLRPEVMIILDRDKNLCDDFKTVDLRMNTSDDDLGKESMWIDRGLEPGSFGIDPSEYFL